MANKNLGNGIKEMLKAQDIRESWKPMPVDPLEEPFESYNDYYANDEPITHSERNLNLAAGNDEPVYKYLYANRKNLMNRLAKGEDYQLILKKLQDMGTWSKGDYNPKAIRKEYLQRLLEGFED